MADSFKCYGGDKYYALVGLKGDISIIHENGKDAFKRVTAMDRNTTLAPTWILIENDAKKDIWNPAKNIVFGVSDFTRYTAGPFKLEQWKFKVAGEYVKRAAQENGIPDSLDVFITKDGTAYTNVTGEKIQNVYILVDKSRGKNIFFSLEGEKLCEVEDEWTHLYGDYVYFAKDDKMLNTNTGKVFDTSHKTYNGTYYDFYLLDDGLYHSYKDIKQRNMDGTVFTSIHNYAGVKKKGDKYYIGDLSGYEKAECDGDVQLESFGDSQSTIVKFKKDGKFGVYDYSASIVSDPIYDELTALDFDESGYIGKVGNKYYTVSSSFKKSDTAYDHIKQAGNYHMHALIKKKGNLYGVENYKGDVLVPYLYSSCEFDPSVNLFKVKRGGSTYWCGANVRKFPLISKSKEYSGKSPVVNISMNDFTYNYRTTYAGPQYLTRIKLQFEIEAYFLNGKDLRYEVIPMMNGIPIRGRKVVDTIKSRGLDMKRNDDINCGYESMKSAQFDVEEFSYSRSANANVDFKLNVYDSSNRLVASSTYKANRRK